LPAAQKIAAFFVFSRQADWASAGVDDHTQGTAAHFDFYCPARPKANIRALKRS
jgi:hypothetical protein